MRTLLVTFILHLSFQSLKSQGSFLKGYIINDKGDTLKGEVRVNPKKDHEAYAKVFFKDANNMQKNYKPEKIKGYGYENNHFISTSLDGESWFLLVITRGTIGLYKTITESLKMNEPVFLTEYYIIKEGNNTPVSVKESRFKKQIAELMKDNVEIAAGYAEEKKFDLEKATELINNYNTWKAGK